MQRPFIVGIGGTTKPDSSTERALTVAMAAATSAGCNTQMFNGAFLAGLPHYDGLAVRTTGERDFVAAMRKADGVILATPAYHAGVSGLVKNALDLLQETADDVRPYLDGLPVGLIVTAYGWQATGATLASMRTIVHALRGWPTPLGVTINSNAGTGAPCDDPQVVAQLTKVANQVAEFARTRQPPAQADSGPQTQTEAF